MIFRAKALERTWPAHLAHDFTGATPVPLSNQTGIGRRVLVQLEFKL